MSLLQGSKMEKLVLVKRRDGLLEASNDHTLEATKLIPVDGEIIVTWDDKRNAKNHKRYMSFISATFDIQDEYDNKDIWRKILQIKAGHFDAVVDKKGKTHYWPKSISWDMLGEVKFRELFKQIIDVFLRDYEARMSENDLNKITDFQ